MSIFIADYVYRRIGIEFRSLNTIDSRTWWQIAHFAVLEFDSFNFLYSHCLPSLLAFLSFLTPHLLHLLLELR